MSTPHLPSIEVKNLSVVYPNGHAALHDVNFHLDSGRICALVGVNGSGKSTLFKAVMGFVTPRSGSVRIGGLEVKSALRHNLISYVPQSEDVDWNFPILVEDVVRMGRYPHMGFLRRASSADKVKISDALERVGMSDFRRRQIGELSGGQKKRVFLARALAQEAPVILLDEPFTGVDIQTETAIISLMRELATSGHLILVSTHNLGSVPDFCDDVVLINKTILASGPVTTTFTQDNLARTFGGMLRHLKMAGKDLHQDEDTRSMSIITDDEKPLVLYGELQQQSIITQRKP